MLVGHEPNCWKGSWKLSLPPLKNETNDGLGHASPGFLMYVSYLFGTEECRIDKSIQDCDDCIQAKFKISPHKGQ